MTKYSVQLFTYKLPNVYNKELTFEILKAGKTYMFYMLFKNYTIYLCCGSENIPTLQLKYNNNVLLTFLHNYLEYKIITCSHTEKITKHNVPLNISGLNIYFMMIIKKYLNFKNYSKYYSIYVPILRSRGFSIVSSVYKNKNFNLMIKYKSIDYIL